MAPPQCGVGRGGEAGPVGRKGLGRLLDREEEVRFKRLATHIDYEDLEHILQEVVSTVGVDLSLSLG